MLSLKSALSAASLSAWACDYSLDRASVFETMSDLISDYNLDLLSISSRADLSTSSYAYILDLLKALSRAALLAANSASILDLLKEI